MSFLHMPPSVVMLGPAPSQRGGIAAVVALYARSWDEARYRLRHITTYVPEETRNWVKGWNALRALASYFRVLLLDPPDLVHVHFSWRGSFYRKSAFVLLSRLLRVRHIVLHCHGGRFPGFYHSRSALGRWWIRRTVAAADRLLVVSTELRRFFEQLGLGVEVQVLANPVLLPPEVIASVNGAPVVLSVGELRKGKGTYELLAAVPEILRFCPGAEVHLAGTGDTRQIQTLLAREPWGNQVKLLGWVGEREKPELFAKARAFVLPSHAEGLPIAILEAMAYGVPVVGTRVGGIPDVVIEGETGFLVEPGDAAAIASCVVRLLTERELAARFGVKSRERVSNFYQVNAVLEQLYLIYDSLN